MHRWLKAACFSASLSTGLGVEGLAVAAEILVPEDFETIQEAVNEAAAGDTILVAGGSFCGAMLDKPVELVTEEGAVIVGCDDGPQLFGGRSVGFLLPSERGESAASGTTITGFTFDGMPAPEGAPLSFGVFGRFAHEVNVSDNRFVGVLQAITNTGGDGWSVFGNSIESLRPFDCSAGSCRGGIGIVIQTARGSIAALGSSASHENRAENNLVVGNRIEGAAGGQPNVFGVTGILVFAADATVVSQNVISLPSNPTTNAPGQGIVITNVCCGDPSRVRPGARFTAITLNEGRGSEIAVHIEGEGENSRRAFLLANGGRVIANGEELTPMTSIPVRDDFRPPHPFQ